MPSSDHPRVAGAARPECLGAFGPARCTGHRAETLPRFYRLAALFRLFGLIISPARAYDLWLYGQNNLQVEANVKALQTLIQRAGKAGYTHFVFSDSKFAHLGDVPAFYFKNVEQFRQTAAAAGVEIVPAVFPVGYSNDILYHNPNLAEGPPVIDERLVVKGGQALSQSEQPPVLKGGDFSNLSLWDWKDPTVVADNGAAKIENPNGANARIVQKVNVLPWHQYHIRVRVKTQSFGGTPQVSVLAGGRGLNFDNLGTKPSQDWETCHVVFNSLTNRQVGVYFGAWGATTGTLWCDDAASEEVALLNLVRRSKAPFALKTEDGRVLEEGKDFEPVSDPLMGSKPWPGCYTVYHKPPVITMKGTWPDGTVLRVTYQHVATVYDGQAMIDLTEPETMDLMRDQARRVHQLWHAKGYMMEFDEIRTLGWSPVRPPDLTPGKLLARAAKECSAILREVNPGGAIYTWNDMFDPHHNAVGGPYYLVNGSYIGAWEGLDPDVVVVNWNGGKKQKSLSFFDGRKNHQVIAGYYDGPLTDLKDWLDAAKNVGGVDAVMYTTWRGDYSQLEAFAEMVKSRK